MSRDASRNAGGMHQLPRQAGSTLRDRGKERQATNDAQTMMPSLALTLVVWPLPRAAFGVFGDSAATHPAPCPGSACWGWALRRAVWPCSGHGLAAPGRSLGRACPAPRSQSDRAVSHSALPRRAPGARPTHSGAPSAAQATHAGQADATLHPNLTVSTPATLTPFGTSPAPGQSAGRPRPWPSLRAPRCLG